MELSFDRTTISCLDTLVPDSKSTELTHQLRLPEGMPDIGRVIAAWGQPVLRGKEWSGDRVSVTGGMMIWVLYAPEDGTREQCIDCWIPFQMKWELPDGTPEGRVRLRLCHRSVDARSASPRKLILRCLLSAAAELFVPREQEVLSPRDVPAEVEMLKTEYPLRLSVEAGEKDFSIEEELTLPESAPIPDKLICFRLEPVIMEHRVLSDKMLFRGQGNLHMLYRSEEGQLHSWDFPVSFSQHEELDRAHAPDARADVVPAVTGLEAELDEEGHLHLKCGIVCQYRVSEQVPVTLAEDAYSLDRDLQVRMEELEIPVLLEQRRETVSAEQAVNAEANLTVDAQFLPELTEQFRQEDRVELTPSGGFQVLYYDTDRALHCAAARWQGILPLMADENSQIQGQMLPTEVQPSLISGQIRLRAELPMEITSTAVQRIPMVTGVTVGQPRQKDPARPALILCRAGSSRLWDLARDSGSTVTAIRQANGLTGEPGEGQLLLIPVS